LFSLLKAALSGIEKEAWMRFLIALCGLTVAFAAAIFSTVASNLWAKAVLASSALLLAGIVGITTVPYLARRVSLFNVRDVFDYDITREGLVYIGLILVIGIAALNTGNNLLFIIVAAMLAAIGISGVASAAVLRGLELEANLPEHVFADTSVQARVAVANPRRILPSFSVSVVPGRSPSFGRRFRWERSTFRFPAKAEPGKQWIRLPDVALKLVESRESSGGIFDDRIYYPYIAPKSSVSRELELTFPHRGSYVQEGFGLATRFPFSFLIKTRRVPLRREVIVYPSVEPTDELFEILPMITGEFEIFVRGRGHDLYRIRDYLPEDSARYVDWKASARTGTLKVREFTREDERKLRVVFDNPAGGVLSSDGYERGIALAASLAWHFAGENTDLSFTAPDYQGSGDVYDFLRYLALLQPAVEPGSVLDEIRVSDDYNVILTARQRGSIPSQLWQCSYFIFLGEER